MSNLPHIHNLIYGEPWAITEAWHGTLAEIYANKIAGLNTPDRINAELAAAGGQADKSAKPYEIQGDVAIVSLVGPLVPKATMFTRMSGMTSMQAFSSYFNMAMADDVVASVIPLVESPGGTTQGMFESAQVIRDARGKKPIIAFIEGLGASAAYLIASQADEVWASVGATVGSLGVIARMDSDERMMKNAGVDSLVIRSKELKAPGSGGITPNQMTAMHRRVMELDAMMMEVVSSARPRMDMKLAANGDIYTGRRALEVGLVDGITTLEKLIASLSGK